MSPREGVTRLGRWTMPASLVDLLRLCRVRRQRDEPWCDLDDIPRSYRLRLKLGRWLFGDSSAYERGIKLLLENLSPEQRREFVTLGYFHVQGGTTGNVYRICRGRQMNVHQLDSRSRRNCIWCFYPAGGLVDGDVMLAQKLALELFEEEALASANRMAYRYEPAVASTTR